MLDKKLLAIDKLPARERFNKLIELENATQNVGEKFSYLPKAEQKKISAAYGNYASKRLNVLTREAQRAVMSRRETELNRILQYAENRLVSNPELSDKDVLTDVLAALSPYTIEDDDNFKYKLGISITRGRTKGQCRKREFYISEICPG